MPAAAFIVPAVTSIAGSIIGAVGSHKAAAQQQQAGQAAAATYQPQIQGGNAAYDRALGMYGIQPTHANPAMPPSLAQPRIPPPAPQYGVVTEQPGQTQPLPMDGAQQMTMADYGRSGGSYGGR
jgi:hypothetical protein